VNALVRVELEGLTKGLEYNPKEGLFSRCYKDLPCAKLTWPNKNDKARPNMHNHTDVYA
jgi:hypothetical protein